MALMKVIFPHRDDAGVFHAAGAYREVPDHMVERYLQPYPGIGFPVLAKDHNTLVGDTVELSIQEVAAKADKMRADEAAVVSEETPTELAEETADDEAPKARKRK